MNSFLRTHFFAGACRLCQKAPAVLVVALASIPTLLSAGIYDVERARKATAKVVRDGDDWVVTVDFLASQALGASKSAEVNRNLARDFAYRGLFSELGGSEGSEVVISGFQSESSEFEDGHWKARFRIPVNGASLREKTRQESDSGPAKDSKALSEMADDAGSGVPDDGGEITTYDNSSPKNISLNDKSMIPSAVLKGEGLSPTGASSMLPSVPSPVISKPLGIPSPTVPSPSIPKPLTLPPIT